MTNAKNRKQELLAQAICSWEKSLGEEYVITSGVAEAYADNTMGIKVPVGAVIKPESTAEVQCALRIASKFNIPLYPISCGKNWGYGCASPVQEGQVVLDLSRMNKIHEVNSDLAYAVVEPGVTQGQLHEYLESNTIPLWLDATGAGPDASLLGNTIERGFGHSSVADHFNSSCSYEVVLANGEVVETGFGHYNCKTKHTYKPGIGPALDGIFTQSNYGIVTRMTVWLMPRAEYLQLFAIKFDNKEQFLATIPALRRLKQQGIIQNTLHIANDLRVLSTHGSCPVSMSDEYRETWRRSVGIGAWNCLGAFYTHKNAVPALKTILKRELRGLTKPIFVDERRIAWGRTLCKILPNCNLRSILEGRIKSITGVLDLLKGKPSNEYLKGIYWKVAKTNLNTVQLDPKDPMVGLYWISPILPFCAMATEEVLQTVESTLHCYKFDSLITLNIVNDRSLSAIISISFNKQDQHQTTQAAKCYKELSTTLYNMGYPPYRTSIRGMDQLNINSNPYWHIVKKIKVSLDPNNIIAPGRYLPETGLED